MNIIGIKGWKSRT